VEYSVRVELRDDLVDYKKQHIQLTPALIGDEAGPSCVLQDDKHTHADSSNCLLRSIDSFEQTRRPLLTVISAF